jgi:hypothetical protein
MRISSLIRPALFAVALALPASHAASASPLGSVATSVAENPHVEKVSCYRHRGYYSGYGNGYYRGYGNGYYRGYGNGYYGNYRRYRDYGYDGYSPSYRAYSYRPKYYRDYGYRDYGY